MKQVQQDGLKYLINEKEEKAEIVGYYEYRNNFLIPRSIKYESQEYIIKSISKRAFTNSRTIKSIEFSSDSELETIEKHAFSYSSIESISIPPHLTKICEGAFYHCIKFQRIDIPTNSELQTIEEYAFSSTLIENIFIPASLIDLKGGWCKFTSKLTTVKVDPRNPRYSNFENKMIICKTTETNENYDEVVFCRRDIKEITIPSFIKIIGSYAFSGCRQLQRIDIPTNSELQTIEEYAFSFSSISSIFIPPHITKICKYAFLKCEQLQRIDFPVNSTLQTIEEGAFKNSSISSIFIPPHVTKICESAFFYCPNLQRIDIPTNSELQTIENEAFSSSPIENIFIPASVIDLKEGWCKITSKLTTVKVDPRNSRYSNYEDKMIICKTTETSENYDKIVFCRRDITEITIPSFIKIIGSYSFSKCFQLHKIDIPTNSKLQTIEKEAFIYSSIESIFIPASLNDLEEGWCYETEKLTTVKVDPRNPRYSNYEDKMIICNTTETNENYDEIVFCRRDITEITIPSFIKIIGSYSFSK